MLILQNLSYSHPNKDLLFSNLQLAVNKHDKIALIGNNGVGKSTLLKIFAGELKASAILLGLLESNDWNKVGDLDFDIEALINERAEAKANKNWARADEIRDELAAEGITLLDGPDGTTWEKK